MFYILWIWNKIKKYWKWIVAFFGGILLYFLIQSKPKDEIAKILKKQISENENLRKETEKSHVKEREEIREIEEESRKKLKKLDVENAEQKEKLHEKHVAEVKEIAEEYRDKPDEIAKKLADKYGIEYVP